jgi:hypothetical protein
MNGKIVKIDRKHGTLFVFQCVKNLRVNGDPTNKLIHGFGSLRESDLSNQAKRLEFWLRTMSAMDKLIAENVITKIQADKISGQFERVVSKQFLPLPLPAPTKSQIKSLEAKYPILSKS